MKVLSAFAWASVAVAHTIQGMDSIKNQMHKRDLDIVQTIYDELPYADQDFVDLHSDQLLKYNSTKCDMCKNRIRYARNLIDEDPDNAHLISLTLFKTCMDQKKSKISSCNMVDFFISTHSDTESRPVGDKYLSLGSDTSVNFYDNDFIHMLKNFNVSSEIDLEYYCYYKQSKACKLPATPDIDEIYDFDSKWPAKQPKHHAEPDYGVAQDKLELFNVLHITDFHTQLRYKVGSEANCTSGLCCLPESFNKDLPDLKNYNFTESFTKMNGEDSRLDFSFYPDATYENDKYVAGEYYDFPKARGWDSVSSPASTFGGYLCDSPEILINNTLQFVREFNKHIKSEFTLFTGDLVDHDKIHCTPEVTLEAETLGFNLMKHYLEDQPVFPALGNHDTYPYGQLVPPNFDTNNTYAYNSQMMAKLWVKDANWIPEEDVEEIRTHYSGFSTITKRGLKVIAMNSNTYYQKNLWNYIDLVQEPDRYGQWQFLIDELVESEAKDQRVWLLAHIPSNQFDTLPIQSRIFAKIVERFSPYTIANIFYGHTHRDQFTVFYSSDSRNASQVEKEVINMSWIGQSVTPKEDLNPAFKYYEVEDKSFNVRNSYSYFTQLNTTFVNAGAEPEWQYGYSARKHYDPEGTWGELNPLNATFWNNYVLKNLYDEKNIDFNQGFLDLQYRNSPNVPNCRNGTELVADCYSLNFCESGTDWSEDYIKCSA